MLLLSIPHWSECLLWKVTAVKPAVLKILQYTVKLIYEVSCLPGYNAMWSSEIQLTLWRNMLPSSE
jgi:hypothetical protein